MRMFKTTVVTTAVALGLGLGASAQYAQPAGASAGGDAKLMAELVNVEAKARKQEATVTVTVSGVQLVDPSTVNEKPQKGQGHLHYQVDNGPVIATTTTKLSFHGLTPGRHKIMVVLAANDHSPLGPQQSLEVTVPASTSSTK
jgi:hypothetical protein